MQGRLESVCAKDVGMKWMGYSYICKYEDDINCIMIILVNDAAAAAGMLNGMRMGQWYGHSVNGNK